MDTITIPREEYVQLQEIAKKVKLIDSILHKDDTVTRTYGIARDKSEKPFTKEIREKIAEAHTFERAEKLRSQL